MRVEMLTNQFYPEHGSVFPGQVIEVPDEQGERLIALGAAKKTTAKVRGPEGEVGNVSALEGRRVPGSLDAAPFTGPTGIEGRPNHAAVIDREDVAGPAEDTAPLTGARK